MKNLKVWNNRIIKPCLENSAIFGNHKEYAYLKHINLLFIDPK